MEKNKNKHIEIKEEDLPKRSDFKTEEEYLEYMDQYLESIGYFEDEYEERDGKMVRKPKKLIPCKRIDEKLERFFGSKFISDPDMVKYLMENASEVVTLEDDSFLYDDDDKVVLSFNEDGFLHDYEIVKGENSDNKRKD